MGDEGVIVFKLDLGSNAGKEAFTSITPFALRPTPPLAGEIIAYQKHRVKRLRRQPWRQHLTAGANLVGQPGKAERHTLARIAFGLAVQRLMLPELLEQDHRQQTGAGPAAGGDVERRRRLADLLAVPAGKFLAVTCRRGRLLRRFKPSSP